MPPVQSPVAKSPPTFSITLGFDSTVPREDYSFAQTAAARWERVVTSEFADTSSANLIPFVPNCLYPAVIDDFYVCVTYGFIAGQGVVGLGGPTYLRPDGSGMPLAGFAKVQTASVPGLKTQPDFLVNTIMHEMGHAMVSLL
jgi:hypothetical protein